jgi:hypothetical protein
MTFDRPPTTSVARSQREAERERIMAEKTAPARAAEAEVRRQRAEAHRIAALPALADKLAGIVFDEIERQGRVLVKDQLADALHAALLRSGLARDPRFAEMLTPAEVQALRQKAIENSAYFRERLKKPQQPSPQAAVK